MVFKKYIYQEYMQIDRLTDKVTAALYDKFPPLRGLIDEMIRQSYTFTPTLEETGERTKI
jgi:hypothetical protein